MQEALQNFLSSWQAALAHMATPHEDIPAATKKLASLRQTFTADLVSMLMRTRSSHAVALSWH